MKAIQLKGDIDENQGIPTGPVQLIVLIPEEDEAGTVWLHGITKEWSADLNNPEEDIHTIKDGQPLNAPP